MMSTTPMLIQARRSAQGHPVATWLVVVMLLLLLLCALLAAAPASFKTPTAALLGLLILHILNKAALKFFETMRT